VPNFSSTKRPCYQFSVTQFVDIIDGRVGNQRGRHYITGPVAICIITELAIQTVAIIAIISIAIANCSDEEVQCALCAIQCNQSVQSPSRAICDEQERTVASIVNP